MSKLLYVNKYTLYSPYMQYCNHTHTHVDLMSFNATYLIQSTMAVATVDDGKRWPL